MAFSDDEEKTAPQSVSNYYFVDDEDKPVDFSLLPIQWSGSESINGNKKLLFLNGTTDNGLQKIFKHVTAWKFDLRTVKPEISVLTKEGVWFKLQKPRKSFEELIRTTMITMQSLHFLKRNPEASAKSLWDHLYRVFSLYELRPSQNDLVDHMALISEAVKRDDSLANSKFLSKFLEEKPKKRKITDEDLPHQLTSGFIVDDMDDLLIDDVEDDESDDEDCFDSVCSFCDNGGELLCCEGRCLRSFHATVEAGEESVCESLGLTDKEVKTMENFFCDNCKYEQHQCFACGQLGSSSVSSGAEVFCCVSATCGYFYHPRCVARLLHLGNQADAEALEKRIVSGETFTCPIHKCCVCKQGEDKKVPELQFAVCRRCPKSYHRKCLPREIAFEDIEEDFIITRAWEGLLPNRILIYCLEHEIDDEIGTPIRDHLKFPVSEENKTVVRQSRRIVVEKKEKKVSKVFISKEKAGLKKKNLASDDSPWDKTAAKAPKQLSLATHNSQTVKKGENVSARPCSMKKARISDASSKCLKNNMKSTVEKDRSLATDEDDTLGERLYTLINQGSEQVKLKRQDTVDSELNKNANVKPTTKTLSSELPLLDANTERRLLALMKESESSITLEDVIKKHKVPSTHPHSSKNVVDKTITLGKVEASVEAARAALQKLLDGSSIEDAKAVCEPQILKQIFKWKEKLRVYLAPFLHGMRYTSFGRHFTKVEKLQEIVDKLHWYVQDGDMIVDFCCGANDFSCLMKKKLEETGKKCSYKNYDVIEPKNNFNFERRDWMTVKQGELLPGSKLIMGINPPFGVKAALANKFINKALEFNPKLLILIVPPETERLDKKKLPYELVWEDDQFLSGKAFYLPGSIDDGDKQMDQWNVKSPPLSLWSHCDWAAEHNEIAKKHHHLSMQFRGSLNLERNSYGDTSMLTGSGGGSDGTSMDDLLLQDKAEELREVQGSQGFWKNQPHETSRKRKCGEENSGRGVDKKPQLDEQYIVKSSQDGVMSNQYIELLDKQYGDDISRQYGGYLTEECKVHMRDGADGLAYRQYSEVGRESAMRSQIHLYGHGPDASGQGFYVLGSDLGHGHMVSTSYRHPGSTPESSYRMNESAKQRYAPRLDGLNHTRMNSLRSDLPLVGSNDPYDLWATQSGYRLDSIGFDSGSRPPFCHDNTPGWLND